MIYNIHITGAPFLNHHSVEIDVHNIDMRNYHYYVIEKCFFLNPGNPDTPITQ